MIKRSWLSTDLPHPQPTDKLSFWVWRENYLIDMISYPQIAKKSVICEQPRNKHTKSFIFTPIDMLAIQVVSSGRLARGHMIWPPSHLSLFVCHQLSKLNDITVSLVKRNFCTLKALKSVVTAKPFEYVYRKYYFQTIFMFKSNGIFSEFEPGFHCCSFRINTDYNVAKKVPVVWGNRVMFRFRRK